MRYALLVCAYVVTTSASLLLYKQGAARSSLSFAGGTFSGQVDWRAAVGVMLYFISFLFWGVVLAARPVMFIVPLATALVHLSILAGAFVFLHERVSGLQLVGIALVLVGVLLMVAKT
jgi:drug/metabolite transporter (DMT)-like permease